MCRVDVMAVCEAGVYSLRTGAGPLSVDPGCGSSHCELLTQDNIATLVVVSPPCMHPLSAFQTSKHVVCAGERKWRGDTWLPVALWPFFSCLLSACSKRYHIASPLSVLKI
jgi:hypothetical protein